MIHSQELFSNGLLLSHPCLQLTGAAILWRRGLHKQFPVFFTYLLAEAALFAILFPVYKWGDSQLYFNLYCFTTAIGLVLGFKVIQEVFLDVFRPYPALKDLGNVVFRWAGIVMLIVAAVVAAAGAHSNEGPLLQAAMTVQRCLRLMQLGLILFSIIFSKHLGISWKQLSFGISLGFGGFAAAELLGFSLRSSGIIRSSTLDLAVTCSYTLTLVIWNSYVLMKQPSRDSVLPLTSQRWDNNLNGLNQPATGDSLIPMFEEMVDRALSRTRDTPPKIEGESSFSQRAGQ